MAVEVEDHARQSPVEDRPELHQDDLRPEERRGPRPRQFLGAISRPWPPSFKSARNCDSRGENLAILRSRSQPGGTKGADPMPPQAAI